MNDRPVACQIREPTDPQGDRWNGEAVADEVSPRSGVKPPSPPQRAISRPLAPERVSDGDNFAPAGSVPPIPRRRQPLPTHCGAPRRNGRDLIIAKNDQRTNPYPHCCQRQRRRDSFAPRRERFLCLRRPHFFQQRKKWGKERRQKLRFCTSSARYTRQ